MGTCRVGQELWRAQVGGEPHTTQMLAARKIYLLRKKKNTERDRRKKHP